jgi:chaperonin GroES
MSRAGKKDKLAAGGRSMVIAGGIGDSPLIEKLKKIESGEIKEEVRVDEVIVVDKPQVVKLKFIPKNKHLLVRRDEANALSTTILLAESVEKEQNNTGVVVETNCVDYPVGIRVVFGKYAGTEYRLNGELFLIMRDEDIQGLLVRADFDPEVEETFEVMPGTTVAGA